MTTNKKSIRFFDNGTYVTFYSDNKDEIEVIRNCFCYFWSEVDSEKAVDNWSVISQKVPQLNHIFDIEKISDETSLFNYSQVKKRVIGNIHYYIHDLDKVDCLTCFDVANKKVYYYHEQNIEEYHLLRNLIREPIIAKYIDLGYKGIHASSCTINEKGVVIPGIKGAGKTSLLTHLLENGARYIGNDFVLYKKDNESVNLKAIPQAVRYTEETINANEVLSNYYKKFGFGKLIDGKVEFQPSLFDRIYLNHCLSSTSKLELVVLPSFDLARFDYSIQIIDYDRTLLNLSMLYILEHDFTWSPFFCNYNSFPDVSEAEEVIQFSPRICRLNFGILSYEKQKELFDDISNVLNI